MRRAARLVPIVLAATAIAAALTLTVRVAMRPYGLDVEARTSDATYFDWNPRDTLPGQPPTVRIGRAHPIDYRLPGDAPPWMPALAAWSAPIMDGAPDTLAAIDSLRTWWRARFISFPSVRETFTRIVPPLASFLTGYANPDAPAICGDQVPAFLAILASRHILARSAFLHTDFGAPDWAGHTLAEAWIPEYAKWVLVDPMLGVRYTRAGMPLSLREMAGLYRGERLGEVMVEYPGARVPFPQHRFDMRHMEGKDIEPYFRTPGIWYNSERFAAKRPVVRPTRYYLAWDPDAESFSPVPAEVRGFRLRIAATVAAWVAGLALIGTAWFVRRESRE